VHSHRQISVHFFKLQISAIIALTRIADLSKHRPYRHDFQDMGGAFVFRLRDYNSSEVKHVAVALVHLRVLLVFCDVVFVAALSSVSLLLPSLLTRLSLIQCPTPKLSLFLTALTSLALRVRSHPKISS
jgi:hypothetical protein